MSIEVFKCRQCGFYSYTNGGVEHNWFYGLALGSVPATITVTLCPTCKGGEIEHCLDQVAAIPAGTSRQSEEHDQAQPAPETQTPESAGDPKSRR